MRKRLSTNNAPKSDAILSQAIVTKDLIFVSGQIHSTAEGEVIKGSIEEKVQQIMKNIRTILNEADATLDDVVKTTIYVTDMMQMLKLNEVYPEYFTEPYPAREAVCVKELPLGATIEISVIALKK